MAIYLLDYENTKSLDGVSQLAKSDVVYFFYSKNAKAIPINFIEELQSRKVKVEYICADAGKNVALDFQLASYLGYLIGTLDTKEIYIVSKDKAYEGLVGFWSKQKNITVRLTSDFEKLQEETKIVNEESDDTIENVLSEEFGYDNKIIAKIFGIIDKNEEKDVIVEELKQYVSDEKMHKALLKRLKPYLKGKA